ncbi:unnamed protein product [Bursaphelenchus xylophilus]|uniref:(pine wood nematode) hypothetical protein n=1 Tax=Bursaphelenchus xylophilus TaxID=6326 RepID=A0A1I7RVC5_BURXY|nr:unnamed protein product [Bursaphelenchus xylophilus]CAG9086674.1 unnamed protein product [Bursaphelenchus xylophilus]
MEMYGQKASLKNVLQARVLRPARFAVKKNISNAVDSVKNGIGGNIKTVAVLATASIKMKTHEVITAVSSKVIRAEKELKERIEKEEWDKEQVRESGKEAKYKEECYKKTKEELLAGAQKFDQDLGLWRDESTFAKADQALYELNIRTDYTNMYQSNWKRECDQHAITKKMYQADANLLELEVEKGFELMKKNDEEFSKVTNLHDHINEALEKYYEILAEILDEPQDALRDNQRAGNPLITKSILLRLNEKGVNSSDVLKARECAMKIQGVRKRIHDLLKKWSRAPDQTSGFFAPEIRFEENCENI